jgi:adenosine deaminase
MLHRFLVPPYVKSLDLVSGGGAFLEAARNIKLNPEQGATRFARRVSSIIEAYLEDESVFKRGQTLIDVPVRRDEVEALNAVQYALRRGVAQRGIVIEVNPSSNLLIGDLRDLRNHPILRLHPPVREQDSPPSVAIALGSDDPVTFSSQLLNEYILLHEAACSAGYPEPVVQEWLELVRRTGMDARFTKAWRPSAKVKCARLIENMKNYLHEP